MRRVGERDAAYAKVESRKYRRIKAAEWAKGVGCRVSPSPPVEGDGESLCPLLRNFFVFILVLNIASFDALWILFYTSVTCFTRKTNIGVYKP